MRTTSLVGLVARSLLSAAALAGCTATSSDAAPLDAEAVCPATVAATVGQTCGVDGLSCSPQYPCGLVVATATCSCQGGRFSCTDVTGRSLGPGDAPACPSFEGGAACPVRESTANLSRCSEPGLVCSYPSRCPSVRLLDQCQCFTGTTTSGTVALRFECSPPCGVADASTGALDAGGASSEAAAVVDARFDSTPEAGPAGGEASTDARSADGTAD